MTLIDRLKQFIDYEGISTSSFEQKIGASDGMIRRAINKNTDIQSKWLTSISDNYHDLNIEWLVSGRGEMLKKDNQRQNSIPKFELSISQYRQKGYAPYYSNFPVSAGKLSLMNIEESETPESWIKFPGVEVDGWFPVIGCSMEPKIYAGDIVGIKQLDSWERLDPDKTYLIITCDDRMIKHLETDDADNDILWAVSENYKRFKIVKDDIIRIFRIVWAGRFV
jgi:phage repressor protein C with HTH and peptisase S24 domain